MLAWEYTWADIVLGQFHAFGGETIDVRRTDRRAMQADISPTEVIGEDVENIGLTRGGFGTGVDHFASITLGVKDHHSTIVALPAKTLVEWDEALLTA
jgi:hypothetical protein